MPLSSCRVFALPQRDRTRLWHRPPWRATRVHLVSALVVAGTMGLRAPAHAALPTHVQSLFDSTELEASRAVAVSADGGHVYVASGSAVTALARDAGSGALTIVDSEADGVGGIDGLLGASGVALSPDGLSVYLSARSDDAVAVFSRNALTGALTFVEAHFESGLDSAAAIAVSPDGAHVYVASGAGGPGSGESAANAVVAFSRDAGSSALTFVAAYTDGVGGIDGLRGAQGIAVSPDGAHVYVAGAGDGAVAVFARDDVTGVLTQVEVVNNSTAGVSGLAGASAVSVSADGTHVYVTSGLRTSFWVFDNALVVFERDTGTGMLTFVEAHPDGSSGIDGNLQAVGASPDGGHVYVCARGMSVGDPSSVAVFDRDGISGALTSVETRFDEAGGVYGLGNPSGLALSPDAAHLYVAAQSDEAVVVFERDTLAGSLTFVEAARGPILGLERARAVTLSPDGAHVYVASGPGFGIGGDSEIGVFARDAGTGALTFVEAEREGDQGLTGIAGADAVAVSPDGLHVYVTAELADSLVAFDRNGTTGALTFLEAHVDGVAGVSGLSSASGVALSPDGLHVYASSLDTGALAVFERDSGTGALTFVSAQPKPASVGVATSVVVAPDGGHLLASYASPAGVASFARDAGSGLLTLVDVELALQGRGLEGAGSVVLAPDGRHAYVAGYLDRAVAVLRLEATGDLTWLQAKTSASPDVGDVESPGSLAVTPDGAKVLVPAEDLGGGTGTGDELLMFSRNAGTGHLSQRHRAVPGADGVPAQALTHPSAAAASPDGRHVYVTSQPRGFFSGSVPIGRGSITAFAFVASCAAAPVTSGCRAAGRATLLIRDSPNDDVDMAVFRWLRGAETLPGDLGDPLGGTTDYTLCVYDSGGPGDRLIMDAIAPAGAQCPRGPCWQLAGGRLVFANSSRKLPDGMLRLLLQPGAAEQAKVLTRAKGVHLDLQSAPPLVLPVTTQLVSNEGQCWSTTFTVDDVRQNVASPSGPAVFSAAQ